MFRKYYKLFKELISLSKERANLCGGCDYYVSSDQYVLYDDDMLEYNEQHKKIWEIIQNLDLEGLKMVEFILGVGKEVIYLSYPLHYYKRYTPKQFYEKELRSFYFTRDVSEKKYRQNIMKNYMLHYEMETGLKTLGIYIPSNILKNGKPRTIEFADGTVCFRTYA